MISSEELAEQYRTLAMQLAWVIRSHPQPQRFDRNLRSIAGKLCDQADAEGVPHSDYLAELLLRMADGSPENPPLAVSRADA